MMNAFWVIIGREMQETFRDLRFWISFALLGIVLPSMYSSLAVSTQRNLQEWLLLVLLLPATYSVQTAVVSFVSEKEARTIEPLLAIPAQDGEIFGAKVTASAIPPLTIALGATLSFFGAASLLFSGQGYRLDWDFLSVALSLVLALMVLWTMVGIGVLISTRTSSVRSAQQMTALVTLPVLFVVVGQGDELIHAMMRWPLGTGAFFVALNIIIFRLGLRMMRREGIMRQLG